MKTHLDTSTDITDITEQAATKRDKGFTLVELLIVIVILGILATVTVFAVRGITDKGNASACNTDKATLQTAVESYYAQYGSATGLASAAVTAGAAAPNGFTLNSLVNPTVALVPAPPATPSWTAGANPGATLVAAGFLRAVPSNFWVAQNGTLYSLSATCGPVGTLVG